MSAQEEDPVSALRIFILSSKGHCDFLAPENQQEFDLWDVCCMSPPRGESVRAKRVFAVWIYFFEREGMTYPSGL